MQVVRMLATKSALAARIDACGSSQTGVEGRKLKDGILIRFDKILAP
jgi:RNA processing factor Prp31